MVSFQRVYLFLKLNKLIRIYTHCKGEMLPLSDSKTELAEAQATILKKSDKIRELERGYNFKPNPAESALRLEIANLQAELSDLKQNSATASIDLPDAGDLLNELKSTRKKSAVTLADVEKILEILEGGSND